MHPYFIEANLWVGYRPLDGQTAKNIQIDRVHFSIRACRAFLGARLHSAPPVPVAYRASHQHAYGGRRQSRLLPYWRGTSFRYHHPSVVRVCLSGDFFPFKSSSMVAVASGSDRLQLQSQMKWKENLLLALTNLRLIMYLVLILLLMVGTY